MGMAYDAVISADVSGSTSNAWRLDQSKPEFGRHELIQGIASTILLGSFGSQDRRGIDIPEIKLCLLKPDSFNHNVINAGLDQMEQQAHYLHYSSMGTASKKYWFETEPNLNILINHAKQDITNDTIDAEILKRLKEKNQGIITFNTLVSPGEEIPEQLRPTLVILGPKHLANPDTVNGEAKKFIEKLATKKGNTDRIYRNTMLFLLCSEVGYSRLSGKIKDYLACVKIKEEYNTQLNPDAKQEINRKVSEYNQDSSVKLAHAYSIVVKYSASNGLSSLILNQFKNSIDTQINSSLVEALKDEQWLLESVGFGLLQRNNLLPTEEKSLRAKDIYEVFVRYDDKPMITGQEAIKRSLLKYCINGQFAIGSSEDGVTFTKTYFKEEAQFFDVQDETWWVIHPDKHVVPPTPVSGTPDEPKPEPGGGGMSEPDPTHPQSGEPEVREINNLQISGNVNLENYSQIFTSFISPLRNNGIEIQLKIIAKSTSSNPLTENSQEYKIVKESAKQLGLDFEAE